MTGGADASAKPISAVESYNPSTAVWTPAHGMTTARDWHAAPLLANGIVLVAGGNPGPDHHRRTLQPIETQPEHCGTGNANTPLSG